MRTPSLPPQAGFAAKARDLQALYDAAVEAGTVSGALWVTYVTMLFYLTIAIGGVTHRDLLLENPAKVHFPSIDLPLIKFAVLGPLIVLGIHAYTLFHFYLLAGKVGAFHTELRSQIDQEDARAVLRRQWPSKVFFLQYLSDSRDVHTGLIGLMLSLIALLTFLIGPIALLVLFHLQFLPYHNEAISWWQRVAVVIDLVLLWVLWPSVTRGTAATLRWPDFRSGKVAACLLASLLPVLLVFAVATFPGEWLDGQLPSLRFLPKSWRPYDLLVAGNTDLVRGRPSLWSNRLTVPGIDVIDRTKFDTEAKILALPATVSLKERRLEGAVLNGAHLPKADFTGAQLRGAVLSGAKLRKADFTGAQLSEAKLDGADLVEAKFGCGETGSEDNKCANLRGASLESAQLQGAGLRSAQLQGASLDFAQLQGASLDFAQLHGTTLDGAKLQGASLSSAQLQGASLDGANLQGAWLFSAQLQGATLSVAELQGAWLDQANLQGAWLNHASLQGASLRLASVWRARAGDSYADGEGAYAETVKEPTYVGADCAQCDWSDEAYTRLVQLIQETVPAGKHRKNGMDLITLLDRNNKQFETSPAFWIFLEKNRLTLKEYQKHSVGVLRKIGCDASGAPYIVRGLLRQIEFRFLDNSDRARELAAVFLDEANCPGTRGLSEEDKARLGTIRDGAPSQLKRFILRAE